MKKLKGNQSGFTLVELLIVVIIVAVLAGVGIPLLSGNIQRARLTEADAGLGALRTGLRTFFAENRTYVGATLANIGITTNAGNNNGDLDGRYFDDNDYSTPTLALATYCAAVTGGTAPNDAPRATEVAGVSRSVNQDGTFFNSADCT